MSKRTVVVTKKTWPNGYQLPPSIEEIGVGKFHRWGVDYEEFESGPANYTIAIVELADGSVLTPMPHDIKFVDAEE